MRLAELTVDERAMLPIAPRAAVALGEDGWLRMSPVGSRRWTLWAAAATEVAWRECGEMLQAVLDDLDAKSVPFVGVPHDHLQSRAELGADGLWRAVPDRSDYAPTEAGASSARLAAMRLK